VFVGATAQFVYVCVVCAGAAVQFLCVCFVCKCECSICVCVLCVQVRPFIARQPLKHIAEYSINAKVRLDCGMFGSGCVVCGVWVCGVCVCVCVCVCECV